MNINAASLSVAVDLSKSVFQLAVADSHWRIIETHRLTRAQFERWFVNRAVGLVIMETCGSAHHWARWLASLGIEVKLLPAKYVRAYVKRNKTDAADAAALLEAARASDIVPVRVKSIEQQALQGLHRTRSLWMGTRTSRINALRGFCREFGIAIAQGSRVGVEQISRVLADPTSAVPTLIRGTMGLLVEEIRLLEARIAQLECELTELARHSPACETLLSIPGVGLLTATAMVAATSGQVNHFRECRVTSLPGSVSHRRNTLRAAPDRSGASPNVVIATYACSSPTGLAACCVRPASLAMRGSFLIRFDPGRSPFRAAPITTRPPVRWPISSRASATPRLA